MEKAEVSPSNGLVSTLPKMVLLPQYSRWVTADRRRIFIVLDAWHGTRAKVQLLDFKKETEVWRDRAELEGLIKDGSLVRYD